MIFEDLGDFLVLDMMFKYKLQTDRFPTYYYFGKHCYRHPAFVGWDETHPRGSCYRVLEKGWAEIVEYRNDPPHNNLLFGYKITPEGLEAYEALKALWENPDGN